jgi:hypothetical protein
MAPTVARWCAFVALCWAFLYGLQHPESAAATVAACVATILVALWWAVIVIADSDQ